MNATNDGPEFDSTILVMLPDNATSYCKVIEPPRGWIRLNLGEIWRYRDLLTTLIWRDISARYRQSVVGYGWGLIKPLVTVVIFAVVFGNLAKLPSDDVPYSLFTLAALIPWMYFSSTLTGVSTSVTGHGHMLTKVYFPRLILPLASLGSSIVELFIQLLLCFGLMLWHGIAIRWQICLIPALVVYTIATAFAFGLWLTAMNVRFRDVGHAIPFLLQVWMWLSPVVYSSSIVPSKWAWIYGLNPLAGIIDGFRWCLFGTYPPQIVNTAPSLILVVAVFWSGLFFFRRQESAFADVI